MNDKFRRPTLMLITAAVLGTMTMAANAQIPGYWQDHSNGMVVNASGACVRTGNWTPGQDSAKCGADQTSKLSLAPAEPKPETSIATASTPVPVTVKVPMDANALFDFDKSVIKPQGKEALVDVVRKLDLAGADLVLIVSTGNTDSIGSNAYNMGLSERRADAVRSFLIAKGVNSERIKAVGLGKSKPIASNATAEGRAENRHVEIEVTSTRTTP
ncbi:MAG: OmpA family protein [Sulfuricaulis sp.]